MVLAFGVGPPALEAGDGAGAGAVWKLSEKEETTLFITSPPVENPTMLRIMRRGIIKSGMFFHVL